MILYIYYSDIYIDIHMILIEKNLTTSLGSDLVFTVTGGKTKPPKHIMLPFAVNSLTGNTDLIRTLNRLGHGVLYTQVEEIDTALDQCHKVKPRQ